MNIRGFIETSFLDWDGKVASVIFLPNCNLNCPFCSNSALIKNPEQLQEINFDKIENFLKERRDFIDGVVITGGEPTLHPSLFNIIKKIKELDLQVKLDTNGTKPEILAQLLTPDSRLIDYIAMDLKAPAHKYHQAVGTEIDHSNIVQSIKLIMGSGVDYEFRTTVVPSLHDEADIREMAKSIAGAKKFVLQQFVPQHAQNEKLRLSRPHPPEKLQALAEIARKFVPNTITRGI